MISGFDTSALLIHYRREPGFERVLALFDDQGHLRVRLETETKLYIASQNKTGRLAAGVVIHSRARERTKSLPGKKADEYDYRH